MGGKSGNTISANRNQQAQHGGSKQNFIQKFQQNLKQINKELNLVDLPRAARVTPAQSNQELERLNSESRYNTPKTERKKWEPPEQLQQPDDVNGPFGIIRYKFNKNTYRWTQLDDEGSDRIMMVYDGELDWPTYEVEQNNDDDPSAEFSESAGPTRATVIDVPFDAILQDLDEPKKFEGLEFLNKTQFEQLDWHNMFPVKFKEGNIPVSSILRVKSHPRQLVLDENDNPISAPHGNSVELDLWISTGPEEDRLKHKQIQRACRRQYYRKHGKFAERVGTQRRLVELPRFGFHKRRQLTSKRLYERLQGMH